MIIDISDIVSRHFSDDSLASDESPRIVVLMGGPASGKTTIRKSKFSKGYVLIDAAEIFTSLEGWEEQDFPGELEQPLSIIGPLIAQQAVRERRNIVTEIIGEEFAPTVALLEAVKSIGYTVEVQYINCGIEEAMKRNLSRGNDSISAYYAEPYHRQWLIDAAEGVQTKVDG